MKAHILGARASVAAVAIAFVIGGAVTVFPQEEKKVPTLKREPAPVTSAISGGEMYHAYCAACHGSQAKGNGPAAPALKAAPTDLTMLAKQHGGEFPAADFEQVLTGQHTLAAHGDSEMPVWGQVFKRMPGNETLRIYNLSKFIESLQAK